MENNPRTPRQSLRKQPGPELPGYMRQSNINTPVQRAQQTEAARGNVTSSLNASSPSARYASLQGASRAPRASNGQQSSASAQKGGRSTSGASGGNGGKRKKKITKAQKLMQLSLIIFGALILIVGGILLLQDNTKSLGTTNPAKLEGKKFFDGVTIENVDIGGKTLEEAKPLVEQAIRTRMGSVSIALTNGEKSWSITAADLGLSTDVNALMTEALSYGRDGSLGDNADAKQLAMQQGKNFEASFILDRNSLVNRLYEITAEANKAPIEPHLIPSLIGADGKFEQKFEPVQGSNGLSVNTEATADAICALIESRDYHATLEPIYDEVLPSLPIDFLQSNLDRISTFSTNYASSKSNQTTINRCFNVQKAADKINCYVVQDGEEFSFNGWVGPRTKDTGWKEANGISKGKEYTLQYGGGICQVSTTLYGALLRGNIPVTDRRKHTIPSDYVPFGQDATVDTSGIDLKFLNDTGAPIYIFAYTKVMTERKNRMEITVSLYGKKLPEGVKYEPRTEILEEIPNDQVERVDESTIPLGYEMERFKQHTGYIVELYIDKYENGTVVNSRRLYKEKYDGNNQRILVGTGDPAKTSVPEGAVPVGSIGSSGAVTSGGDTAEVVPTIPETSEAPAA